MTQIPTVTGKERFFERDEIIVSKTDLKGHITYANDVFLRIADYTEEEVLGQPHSIIRHPHMPRCVFKLLWETIQGGGEIFAYVMNRTKGGDHYWVLAHVTPSRNARGDIVGYHSNRRVPEREPLEQSIIPLYERLRRIENENSSAKQGLQDSLKAIQGVLAEQSQSYDEFVWSL